jgi:hypothetical protein
MFSFTSFGKKQNNITIPIKNFMRENFQKNMNGILVKKYCNDCYYKSNIDSNNNDSNDNNNDSNNNTIIIIILASVTTSFCFYFYKSLKM